MSGTSGDGVSLALCRFQGKSFRLLNYETFPYPKSLSDKIISGSALNAAEISRLNFILGEFFGNSVLKFLKNSKIHSGKIFVAGSHGQTIYHGPYEHPRNTLQIGEPSVIAEKTGIPVVADFRTRDIAAGGQGAPLIPFFDQYFFGTGPVRALQNIGGIANVTVTGKSIPPIAFDTGPGNCLIDWAVQKMTKNRLRFDLDGKIAESGAVDINAIREMARHPYFKKNPPKSTGRELFNARFIPTRLRDGCPKTLIATLTYFTAYTIHQSYERFIPFPLSEIIVSGGGALNKTLMSFLSILSAPIPVRSIETYGIPTQAKEPVAFAFFALRAIEGKSNHLPRTTGAARSSILGKIIPGKSPDAAH